MLTAKYSLDSLKDQILGCHGSVAEYARLLDVTCCWVGGSGLSEGTVVYFRTSGTRHLVTPHHIPEDLNSK
jgi:hypothetical protein